MGLDVYLYLCNDRAKAKAAEEEYERESEAIWNRVTGDTPYDKTTDEQRAKVKAETDALAARLGIVDYGTHNSVTEIREDSAKHPEHYFKIGYFRSSYNDSGINNWLRRHGLETLDDIMGPTSYEFTPDWRAARDRAQAVIDKINANRKDFALDTLVVTPNLFTPPPITNPEQALAAYRETVGVQTEHGTSFEQFSNLYGHFFTKGFNILALLPGTHSMLRQNQPCTYAVFQNDEVLTWIVQALEIVVETCDWVLRSSYPEKFYLHWSS